MRKLLPLFACLMLVLTGFAGMAHATETAGGSMFGVELMVHAPGDGDEVPADGDNGLPHHHNACHGHDVGTLAVACGAGTTVLMVGADKRQLSAARPDARGGVLPRPPQA
jgi:hypothetical protein